MLTVKGHEFYHLANLNLETANEGDAFETYCDVPGSRMGAMKGRFHKKLTIRDTSDIPPGLLCPYCFSPYGLIQYAAGRNLC
jgi:hypothetical protein